jgi:16S rRNA (adenine1518-N6/adenine1519-N6)-dimethyltransferase
VHVADERFFRRVVKAAFGQRRKTLWNAVRSAHFTADHSLREAFSKAGIDPERRGETLTLAEFAQLAAEIGAIASSDCGA